MLIKIEGGTARNDENLCDTCKQASIATNVSNEKHIQCSAFGMRVTTRIVKCTEWKDTNHQSIYDMREQAWIIGRAANKAGFRSKGDITFKRYRKLTPEEQKDVDLDTENDDF